MKANKRLKREPEPHSTIPEKKKEPEQIISKWSDLKLKPALFEGLVSLGFDRPSAIQQRAILPIIKGRDVICQSQSGTGKTAVFCIACLQIVKEDLMYCQSILLSPTRELAEQTFKVLTSLSSCFPKLNILLCIGGAGGSGKEVALKAKSCQILVGTPGRTLDLVKRHNAELTTHCSLFVIDEADEMITSGQSKLVSEIFSELPRGVQVVLVTATLNGAVMQLSLKYLVDPVRVLVKTSEVNVQTIAQYYQQFSDPEEKFPFLLQLYSELPISQTIVFGNLKSTVMAVSKKLRQAGFTLSVLHGEMDQSEREKSMQEFRNGKSRVLVCTDILGRGIDVQQVSLVVNYDIPISKESYVHRIGRSGRFGRRGMAITFVAGKEEGLKAIEKHYKVKISKINKIKDLL